MSSGDARLECSVLLVAVTARDGDVGRAPTLLYFANGRTMSVKAYRVDGDLMTVTLRGGGEATFDTSMVARIAPERSAGPRGLAGADAGADDAAPAAAAQCRHARAELVRARMPS